ncbi:MAG: HNH endonuclease [Rhizomicrobium sp.]
MARSVPEWNGQKPDSKVPARVRDRVATKQGDLCAKCKVPLTTAQCDHIIPLILGGENRETNLQMLCAACHAGKTKLDVKLKSKVADIRKKRLGIKPKSPLSPKVRGIRKRMDGTIEKYNRQTDQWEPM